MIVCTAARLLRGSHLSGQVRAYGVLMDEDRTGIQGRLLGSADGESAAVRAALAGGAVVLEVGKSGRLIVPRKLAWMIPDLVRLS